MYSLAPRQYFLVNTQGGECGLCVSQNVQVPIVMKLEYALAYVSSAAIEIQCKMITLKHLIEMIKTYITQGPPKSFRPAYHGIRKKAQLAPYARGSQHGYYCGMHTHLVVPIVLFPFPISF
jgi:hypothetical protein